ncbi:hypothetical protein [Silicimonas sp. MF1-12-2]
MNVERLIHMAMQLLFRHGLRAVNKGQKTDPKLAEAAKKLRMGRRLGRF